MQFIHYILICFPLRQFLSDTSYLPTIHQHFSPTCLNFVPDLTILPWSPWVYYYVHVYVVSTKLCILHDFRPHWLLQSFCLLFCRAPWAPRGGIHGDIPFRTWHSKGILEGNRHRESKQLIIEVETRTQLQSRDYHLLSSFIVAPCASGYAIQLL